MYTTTCTSSTNFLCAQRPTAAKHAADQSQACSLGRLKGRYHSTAPLVRTLNLMSICKHGAVKDRRKVSTLKRGSISNENYVHFQLQQASRS